MDSVQCLPLVLVQERYQVFRPLVRLRALMCDRREQLVVLVVVLLVFQLLLPLLVRDLMEAKGGYVQN